MMYKTKHLIFTVAIFLIASTIELFFGDKLYSPIIWFITLNALVVGVVLMHLKRTNSARIFGMYLVVVIIAYNWINFKSHWGFESVFYTVIQSLGYILRAMLTLLLVGYGVVQLISGGKFEYLQRKKTFRVALILIAVFLLTEIPMFGIHGDFGGNSHGHNYLRGMHFH